jgi:hypothetical protein
MNVGIYYGSLIDKVKGTILSACFLYLRYFIFIVKKYKIQIKGTNVIVK